MNVVELEISGNDKQDKREGYNILNVVRPSDTRKGIEFTNNGDGSFTLNGTCSENGLFIDLNNSTGNRFTLTQGKKYLLYLKGIQQGVNFNARTSEDVSSITLNGNDGQESIFRTWNGETSENGFVHISVAKGTVINNKTFYPMIAESDVELEYEAYGAMPSPEYPSEVETVNTQVNIVVENEDGTEQQTKVVDIQQEMLEGDYFVKEEDGWKEVHTWNKLIFTGAENWFKSGASTSEIFAAAIDIENAVVGYGYSNYFKYYGKTAIGYFSVYNNGTNIRFCVDSLVITDLNSFKTWLAQKYNEVNPVYVWYKLATPLKLACTETQNKQLDDLLNTSTYKNVTHIYSTDKVSPIIKVVYRKDLETMLNNQHSEYETRLSNIEKLLSTTTTSALLLDNLQTDIQKEVM